MKRFSHCDWSRDLMNTQSECSKELAIIGHNTKGKPHSINKRVLQSQVRRKHKSPITLAKVNI